MRCVSRIYVVWVVAVVGALVFAGCASRPMPRSRLGSLPFPGLMTLYEPSEISELGRHCYAGWWDRPFTGEGARGIMYTCRGGFIDISHLRESVDWTWYLSGAARDLLEKGGGEFTFENDEIRFSMRVSTPEWLGELDQTERRELLNELSVRMGQRAAYEVAIWHEVATWYGCRALFFVSETGSAFTFEDLSSNLLGTIIGGEVAREGGEGDYDERAARAIEVALNELGPVSRREVDRVARAVEGVWWRNEVAIRRDLDVGLASGGGMESSPLRKNPWLVPGACSAEESAYFVLPALDGIGGRDVGRVYELRAAVPASWGTRLLQGREGREVGGGELPGIVAAIREEIRNTWGPQADSPSVEGWEKTPIAGR